MSNGTIESMRLAPELRGLQTELAFFTNVDIPLGDIDHNFGAISDTVLADNGELSDEIHRTFVMANTVIRDFNDSSVIRPHFVLTRCALNAARNLNTAVVNGDILGQVCFEAELRTSRSLELNEQAKLLPAGHAPAGVAHDMYGVPYGYIKSSGSQIGLAWRSADVATSDGIVSVPAGSFFRLMHGNGAEGVMDRYRHDRASSIGLISLERARMPDDIKMERFSTALVSRQLARAAFNYATGPNDSYLGYALRRYIPQTLSLSLGQLGERVHSLMRGESVRAA